MLASRRPKRALRPIIKGEKLTTLTHALSARAVTSAHVGLDTARQKLDAAVLRYDGWFLVLLAVLMTLAVVIATALAIWCVVFQRKRFTGNWRWGTWGVSVWVECV